MRMTMHSGQNQSQSSSPTSPNFTARAALGLRHMDHSVSYKEPSLKAKMRREH